ncbi:hypothetical protein [Leptothoe kymatousa]|uniref:Uncharacterized protein n=1 Tax=Leptothoe kymatousa TAU-MAC 1615 TaxID=2364775 RepID=A0ABS5Y8J5_9CYAN|nr:hypothetical protein [Leptothoe kymatousa]MBT9313270.1 hypothetical protein [Leptothoe kymatousa TAU-MAC 1615]
MVPTLSVIRTFNSQPPEAIEIQSSMCPVCQPHQLQPIARWILEDGQLQGVLIASCPSPLVRCMTTRG